MQFALFYILAFLSEIIGTIGGFGSSMFLVPLAGFFFDFQTVLAVTAVMHIFSNVSKLILFHKGINKRLLLLIGIPSVVFVLVGAWLSTILFLKYAEIVLGIFLVIFSVSLFIKPEFKVNATNTNAVLGGALAGFWAGLIGTGGAIRGLCLSAFGVEKSAFIATSAAIDLFVDIGRASIYLSNDYLEKEYYIIIPILFIVAAAGSYIGKFLLNYISQIQFKKIVLSLIFIIGAVMIWKTLKM